MKSNVIDITVELLMETPRAILVTDSVPDKGVWLPKSQVEFEPSDIGGLHIVTLPEWLALERGLI